MCPETSTLSAFFDNELSDIRSAEMDEHIRDCPACAATLELFASQRSLMKGDAAPVRSGGDHLEEFWNYVGRSRVQKVSGPRRLSIPIPVAAAAALALVLTTVLNFIPGRSDNMPDVLVIEAAQPAPTVVSLTVTPGELDDFFAALEGHQALDDQGIHVLPAEFPVSLLGEAQIVRPASFEGAP